MDKIVLIEAKCSVGAEQIGRNLAVKLEIPFLENEDILESSCVALNARVTSCLPEDISVVKIYLHADLQFRAALYESECKTGKVQVRKIIADMDAVHREHYLSENLHEIGLTENYDLCINTAFCNITPSTNVAQGYIMCRILQDCLSEVKD